MLKELTHLLDATPIDASASDYRSAIIEENVLLKPSTSTRSKTYSYLRDRFGLDPDLPVFRLLRFLWDRDEPGRPLIALLTASFRDPVLRSTTELLLTTKGDEPIPTSAFAFAVSVAFPQKLGEKTLLATSQRMTSSYLQSGHLRGRNPAIRQHVAATPGSTTLALLLATLEGAGGLALFHSPWVRLLDSPDELVLAEARIAASRGWLEYRQAGDVLEITFHRLLETVGGTL